MAIHESYPSNRSLLAGKQGKPSNFSTPVDMPTLANKYTRELDWEGKVVQSCVHCHQIGDALRAGFLNGDVIVEIDGVNNRLSEGELIGRLLAEHQPGDEVKATVLRDGERHLFALPMQ
jgi:hypothetical protein